VALGGLAVLVERAPIPWPPPVAPTAALLYLAVVGSVLVFVGYFFLLQRVALMTVSTMVVLEPLIALVVDAAGERDVVLAPRTYVGIAVTIGGVALTILPAARRAARLSPGTTA
jgi:drug/metabolite transporter (DMT)-like permease